MVLEGIANRENSCIKRKFIQNYKGKVFDSFLAKFDGDPWIIEKLTSWTLSSYCWYTSLYFTIGIGNRHKGRVAVLESVEWPGKSEVQVDEFTGLVQWLEFPCVAWRTPGLRKTFPHRLSLSERLNEPGKWPTKSCVCVAVAWPVFVVSEPMTIQMQWCV